MKSTAAILGAAAIGVLASTAAFADDSAQSTVADRSFSIFNWLSGSTQPKKAATVDPLTGKPVVSTISVVRPATIYLSMGTGF